MIHIISGFLRVQDIKNYISRWKTTILSQIKINYHQCSQFTVSEVHQFFKREKLNISTCKSLNKKAKEIYNSESIFTCISTSLKKNNSHKKQLHRNIESQPVSIAVQMTHKQAGVKDVKAVHMPSIDECTEIDMPRTLTKEDS